jgi:hypothetical protein
MCVYLYIYVDRYVCMYKYIYIYISMYIWIYMYMNEYVHVFVYLLIYTSPIDFILYTPIDFILQTESDRRLGSEDQNLVPYIESMMETIIGLAVADEEDLSQYPSRDPLESRPVSPVLDALGVNIQYIYVWMYIIYMYIYKYVNTLFIKMCL